MLLFADGDGASTFSDVDLLIERLVDVSIGSRKHPVVRNGICVAEAKAQRGLLRLLLMQVFHLLVLYVMQIVVFGGVSIEDTQCGFKLFTRQAAQELFGQLHLERWIFDVELLYLSNRLGLDVQQVGIEWHEVPGTNLSLVRDSAQMLVQLLMMRTYYLVGWWRVAKKDV